MPNESSPTPTTGQATTVAAHVFAVVRACPVGRVTTYGWLATASFCLASGSAEKCG